MEFPKEIKEYILSYLPHPYKKPPHLDAINTDKLFADFTIERERELERDPEREGENAWWLDSFIEYKSYRRMRWVAFDIMNNIN